MDFKNILFKEHGEDPYYISLVHSEYATDYPETTGQNKIMPYLDKKRKPFMTSIAQLYIASLTIIGLFIIFRLSLAK